MIKESEVFNKLNMAYDVSSIDEPHNILFLDIETTGLSSKSAFIYMIGLSYFENSNWVFTGLFAENASEEKKLLEAFIEILSKYKTLIHFNGNRFDLPFIKDRCKANGLSIDFSNYNGVDIYKCIYPYRQLLGIANCKQKTLEEFAGINRKDLYSGGELISVYNDYVENKSDALYSLLFQHNHDDLLGMLSIISLLNIPLIFEKEPKIIKVSEDVYNNHLGQKSRELMIEFEIAFAIPGRISFNGNDCYVSIREKNGLLKLPIYEEELKFFYDNYKDYYYLPKEDMAVHKALASYVDKEFREAAKACNCYTKLNSSFLPQWDTLVSPFFKRDYDSKLLFFELNNDIKADTKLFSKYTLHLLEMMKNYKR